MKSSVIVIAALVLPVAAVVGPASAEDATQRCTSTLLALQEALADAAPADVASIVAPALVDVQAYCDAHEVGQDGVSKVKGVLALASANACSPGNKWIRSDTARVNGNIVLFGISYPVQDTGPATAGRDGAGTITYAASGPRVALTATNLNVGTVRFFGVTLPAEYSEASIDCRYTDPSQACAAEGYSRWSTTGLTLEVDSRISGWCL